MPDTSHKCPVCGETRPEPAWFCLPRQIGEAKEGEPCSYSVEGHTRMVKKMREKFAALDH